MFKILRHPSAKVGPLALLWLFAVVICASLNVPAQTPTESPATSSRPSITWEEYDAAVKLPDQIDRLLKERKYDEALPLAERYAAIYEKAYGADSLEALGAQSYSIHIYMAKRDYARAELLLLRSQTILEKSRQDLSFLHDVFVLLGRLYYERKEYSSAETAFARALSTIQQASLPETTLTGEAAMYLGMIKQVNNELVQAESFYERALAIFGKTIKEHVLVASTLVRQGQLYMIKRDYQRAGPLLERALAMFEKLQGSESLEVAGSLTNLGEFYYRTENLSLAEQSFNRALTIREKLQGKTHPDLAPVLGRLAAIYTSKRDDARANQLGQRAAEIYQAAGIDPVRDSTSSPELQHARRLRDEVASLVNGGKFDQALEGATRLLQLVEKLPGKNTSELCDALDILGAIYLVKGDFVRAEAAFQRLLSIAEEAFGAGHPNFEAAVTAIAILYKSKGDYTRAESMLQTVLARLEKTYGTESPKVASLLISLAGLYQSQNNYARSEPFARRALAIDEKAKGPQDFAVARDLKSLGLALIFQDKNEEGEPLLLRALQIIEQLHKSSGGGEARSLATALVSVAVMYLGKRQPARAEAMLKRALELYDQSVGPEHPNVVRTLNDLTVLYEDTNEIDRALATQTRATETSERNLDRMIGAGSEQDKRLYMATLSFENNITTSLHTMVAPENKNAMRLSLTTILRRKGRVLDVMSESVEALRRRLDPETRGLLDQLTAARTKLAAMVLSPPEDAKPDDRRQSATNLQAELDRLERLVSARSAEMRARSQPVTIESVQKAIPAGAVLVEFSLYQPFYIKGETHALTGSTVSPRYVAYILTSGGDLRWVDLGDSGPIDTAVGQFRTALRDPKRADVKTSARDLDQKIGLPIRRVLGNSRKIFLSPDGALNLIPFGALVDENGQYLTENYSITYITSGRDLQRLQTTGAARQPVVVFANPAYDLKPNEPSNATGRRSFDFSQASFPSLAGTAGEARAIKTIIPSARVVTDLQASEWALKQVAGPLILHVATHGFFLVDLPAEKGEASRQFQRVDSTRASVGRVDNPLLRSGLALAGANQRQGGNGEDGILTALEVTGLDLWGTKLVVLSACETGLGDIKTGEGVYGLRRALVLAGAESQVMSLWQVSDHATRDLMIEYYRLLQMGEGRSDALRRVQLQMLRTGTLVGSGDNRPVGGTEKSTPVDLSHPFYWASFIQSGGWTPVIEGGTRPQE